MRHYLLLVFLFFGAQAHCAQNDTIRQSYLDDFVVASKRISSPLGSGNAKDIRLDMRYMHRLPKFFGNADPLRYSQMLPGIQTNCEYDAGIHIQGGENSHNLISIEGVPVYNASHLLGFFSTFNPSHFSQISIKKNVTAAEGQSRIGGVVDMMLPDSVPAAVNGEFSVGLISSQGTLRVPLGKNAALFTSLRVSYINMLYSPLLKISDVQLLYSFGDVNATYMQKFDERHTVYVDFYSGQDKAKLQGPNRDFYFNTADSWGNLIGAVHWKYKMRQGRLKQTIYFSGYENSLALTGSYKLRLPSKIYDVGYRMSVSLHNFEAGVSIINHNVKPQTPEYENLNIIPNKENNNQNTLEGSAYAKYSGALSGNFYYDFTLKGDYYNDLKGYTYTALNPYATIAYDTHKSGRVELNYSHQHQYLLNCGFTGLGLPVEFWISAGHDYKPQYVHNFQLSYNREIFKGKYDLSVEAYYKRLYNQVEYNGSPLDILNKKHSLESVIAIGCGYNYGANVMLNKLTGKLTGWISYSYGRAMRRFDIYGDKWFSANHERVHELNAVATCRVSKKFDVGGTFSYATGTPYTMVKYFYFVNNNILTEYGEHNANRLRDYIRLDLSANYDIADDEKRTMGLNFSVYNALCRSNEISYRLKAGEKGITFKGMSFFSDILFSISFYYKLK